MPNPFAYIRSGDEAQAALYLAAHPLTEDEALAALAAHSEAFGSTFHAAIARFDVQATETQETAPMSHRRPAHDDDYTPEAVDHAQAADEEDALTVLRRLVRAVDALPDGALYRGSARVTDLPEALAAAHRLLG